MSLVSSRARRISRRAATLIAVLAVGAAFIINAGDAEAHGAPSWLSRLMRAVVRRESVAQPASDTVAVFGPKTMALGAATSGTFIEKFTIAAPQSGGYLLRVTNGPNGAPRMTGGTVSLNGAVVFSATDFAALPSGATRDVPVIAAAADTLIATLTGPANAAISLSLLTVPDPTFTVFGPRTYERDNGKPVLVTSNFTLPAGARPPSFLCIRNGELDGSRRNSSSRVILNGVEIIGPSDLNQQVAGFLKPVTFQQSNVLQVEMRGSPDSRLTICGMATDSLKPQLTITAPTPSFITRQTQIDAVGVVVEQTAVKITVNGQLASVTPGTAGRLATVARDGAVTLAYEYDANGNRTRTTGVGSVQTASVDAQDRVTAFGNASFGYRPSGELRFKAIGADTTWYHYSAMGALLDVRLPDGTVVGYTIDAEGRRVGKTVNGTIVKGWLYGNDLAVVAEVGPTKSGTNNDIVSRFVFGATVGVPEYMERAGTTYRMIADERGSIRLVVNATTGAVVQQIDYDPFGRVTLNTNPGFQPFGFASGIYDEQTGLIRFGARDYDPETGRWTTKDPIGFNGKSLNLYQYASNDPLNHTDRTGLVGELSEQEAGMAVGAVIATALMARFVQQRQQTESVFGPLTLSYDFKRNWESALEPSDLPKGYTPAPPKGPRHTECESHCNDSMEEKQTWCNGPRGPKFGFQRISCNSAAATGDVNQWLGFCALVWGDNEIF